MTDAQKKGALIFFGAGNCVGCHSVSGQSNEMFSDFRMHVACMAGGYLPVNPHLRLM